MIRLVHRRTVTLFGEVWYLSGIHPSPGAWHEMPSALGAWILRRAERAARTRSA